MKNVDRLARHISKNGAENIMVHTIPGTANWLICQKVDENKWSITLANPLGNVTYNLGLVTDGQHLKLWAYLLSTRLEEKTTQILSTAKELKQKIRYFLRQERTFAKMLKKHI